MGVAKLDAGLLAKKGQAVPFSSLSGVKQSLPFKFPNSFGQDDGGPRETVRKSLRLGVTEHRKLRMLAARQNVSQQQIMELAVREFIKRLQQDETCICRQ